MSNPILEMPTDVSEIDRLIDPSTKQSDEQLIEPSIKQSDKQQTVHQSDEQPIQQRTKHSVEHAVKQSDEQLIDASIKQSDEQINEQSIKKSKKKSIESASNQSDESEIKQSRSSIKDDYVESQHDKPSSKKQKKHKSRPSVHFDEKYTDYIPPSGRSIDESYQTEEKTVVLTSPEGSSADPSVNSSPAVRQRRNKPKRSSDHVPFSNSLLKRPVTSKYGNPSNHYQSNNQSNSPTSAQLRAHFVSSPQPFTPAEIAQQKERRKSWLKQTEHQLAQVHQNAQAIKARESRMQLIGLIFVWLLVIGVMIWFVYRSMQFPSRPSVKRLVNQSRNPTFNHSQWWT